MPSRDGSSAKVALNIILVFYAMTTCLLAYGLSWYHYRLTTVELIVGDWKKIHDRDPLNTGGRAIDLPTDNFVTRAQDTLDSGGAGWLSFLQSVVPIFYASLALIVALLWYLVSFFAIRPFLDRSPSSTED